VGLLKHRRRRCDGRAADDNAVTKAWGAVAARRIHDVLRYSCDHSPTGVVDELQPPHQILVRARPKLDAFCALRPSLWQKLPRRSCARHSRTPCLSVRAHGHTSLAIGQYQVGAIHCGWTAHRVWMIQRGGCPSHATYSNVPCSVFVRVIICVMIISVVAICLVVLLIVVFLTS
jgi:hypothetical protein